MSIGKVGRLGINIHMYNFRIEYVSTSIKVTREPVLQYKLSRKLIREVPCSIATDIVSRIVYIKAQTQTSIL